VLLFSISGVDWNGIAGQFPATVASPEWADDMEARKLHKETTGTTPEAVAAVGEAQAKFESRRQSGRTVRQLGLSFFGLRPDRDLNQKAGDALAPGFLLPFEIGSIHLLVVWIGAAYLARAKRRVTPGSGADL